MTEDDGEKQYRQNFDKNTIRQQFSVDFSRSIRSFRGDNPVCTNKEVERQNTSQYSVRVLVRKRPIFQSEKQSQYFDVVTARKQEIVVHDCRVKCDMKTPFIQNVHYPLKIFNDDVKNEDIVDKIALCDLIGDAVDGGESTIVMFGQTGSGKTYTISAIAQAVTELLYPDIEDQQGLPASYFQSFQLIGNQVFDLLKNVGPLQCLEDHAGKFNVVNLAYEQVFNGQQARQLLRTSFNNRPQRATYKNDVSSRSHAFYQYLFPRGDGSCGRLRLVDLAGSEGHRDSLFHKGQLISESVLINQSLGALNQCIRAMSLALQNPESGIRVPFRNSRLTMCLREALEPPAQYEGGGERRVNTLILACISPCSSDTEQTVSTLRKACLMAGVDEPTQQGDVAQQYSEAAEVQQSPPVREAPLKKLRGESSNSEGRFSLNRRKKESGDNRWSSKTHVSQSERVRDGVDGREGGGASLASPQPRSSKGGEGGDLWRQEFSEDDIGYFKQSHNKPMHLGATSSSIPRRGHHSRQPSLPARLPARIPLDVTTPTSPPARPVLNTSASMTTRPPPARARLFAKFKTTRERAPPASGGGGRGVASTAVQDGTVGWWKGETMNVVPSKLLHNVPDNVKRKLAQGGVVKHPFAWSNSELKEWLAGVGGGRFKKYVAGLGSSVDGSQLKKWSNIRYKQLCNGSESDGAKLRALLNDEKERASKYVKLQRQLGDMGTDGKQALLYG